MRTRVLGKLVLGIVLLVFMLLSCQASDSGRSNQWATYRNPRYNFEFPYPSNWKSLPIPDNLDGRAFRDPENPSVEIRGWAAHKLLGTQAPSPSPRRYARKPPNRQQQKQNFTTKQGFKGELQVEICSDKSLMTLTLNQDKVLYKWQGKSDSKQFADHYSFFYNIATQYRLPAPEKR